jgi:hypothetical protein
MRSQHVSEPVGYRGSADPCTPLETAYIASAMLADVPPPVPVVAIVETTRETFAGRMVGEELLIRSDGGPECSGRVRLVGTAAYGNLRCSDGRFGHFTARLIGGRGSAYGTLGGQSFTLAIG